MHRVSMLGFPGLLRLPIDGLHATDKWRLNQSQIEAILSAPEDLQKKYVDCPRRVRVPLPIRRLDIHIFISII